MELYSITICGLKFYFEAQVSDEQCKHIDKMCKRMQKGRQTESTEDIYSLFLRQHCTIPA